MHQEARRITARTGRHRRLIQQEERYLIPTSKAPAANTPQMLRSTWGVPSGYLTPVTLGKSKTFMRANLDLACEAILVDATKATAIGKDLYLVLPKVAADGGLEGWRRRTMRCLCP